MCCWPFSVDAGSQNPVRRATRPSVLADNWLDHFRKQPPRRDN
jgi:hypothetical protein